MSWILRTLLTICLVTLPLYLYIGLRLAGSVGLVRPAAKRRARKIALLVIGWFYTLPLAVFLLFIFKLDWRLTFFARSISWADYLFNYPAWISLIIVVELLGPFVVLDLVALAGRLAPSQLPALRKLLAYVRLGLAALAIVYIPIRVAFDTTHVRDTSERISLPGLPSGLDSLTITLVGDIQVDRYTGESKVRQVHQIVDAHAPELLLSAGDVVTSGTDFLVAASEAMCGMRGSLASVGVMGDHDYWSAPEAVRDLQLRCGWVFLQNEHRIIPYRGSTILISGLTNVYSSRLNDDELDEFLGRAPKADLRILLMHQPAERVIMRAAEKGYDLILAGHTHGGQIVLHPLGLTFTPSMRETRFYTGTHQVGSAKVVVTDGVGVSIAPIRYHAPAEVTTIVLQTPK